MMIILYHVLCYSSLLYVGAYSVFILPSAIRDGGYCGRAAKKHCHIEMATLSHYISYILDGHEKLYDEMTNRLNPDELSNVFL